MPRDSAHRVPSGTMRRSCAVSELGGARVRWHRGAVAPGGECDDRRRQSAARPNRRARACMCACACAYVCAHVRVRVRACVHVCGCRCERLCALPVVRACALVCVLRAPVHTCALELGARACSRAVCVSAVIAWVGRRPRGAAARRLARCAAWNTTCARVLARVCGYSEYSCGGLGQATT